MAAACAPLAPECEPAGLDGELAAPLSLARSAVPGGALRRADDDTASVVASEAPSSVVVANPCPLKRIPPNVLVEEDYAEAVSSLIERDFFPDLPQLRVQRGLLEALRDGDKNLAHRLRWELANMSRPTPMSTPAGTPCPTPLPSPAHEGGGSATRDGLLVGSAAAERLRAWERDDDADSTITAESEHVDKKVALRTTSGKDVVVDLSRVRLDDFQRVFTSEDNASFEKILERDKAAQRARQWWIEDSEKRHNTKLKAQMKALEAGCPLEGEVMSNPHKGRNALCFFQESLPQQGIQKPRVDVKNTRFTTKQQQELDDMLAASFAARRARLDGERLENAYEQMARDGKFKELSEFIGEMRMNDSRALGGRLEAPLRGGAAQAGAGSYPMVRTPALLPGEGGLSPLMTYGKVASTPKVLDEAKGPAFFINAETDREAAADRLQRGALQKQRESKSQAKADRLRALGLTPAGTTPAKSTPGSLAGRGTPGSVASSSRIAPLSPIGQLIHRAQKLAQRGGQLRINSGGRSATPRPTPTPTDAPRAKRARVEAQGGLSASITDGLLR